GVRRPALVVHGSPLMLVGKLRAVADYLVVAPRNAHQLRGEYLRGDDFGGFEIGGDENPGAEPDAGRLRCDGVRQITCRRAGDNLESELARLCQSDRDYAIFKAQSWQADGIVLDVEILRSELLG